MTIPDAEASRLRPASILLGVVVDKAVFLVSVISLAALWGVKAPAFEDLALAFGLGATTLGGFVAARHARARWVAHGLAVGLIALAISFSRFTVNQLWPPAEQAAIHPMLWELTGWAGAVAAGALGGWWAAALARRSDVVPGPGAG